MIQQFIDASPEFQLKFVVAAEGDLGEIDELLGQLRGWTPADVLLMPEGIDAATLDARARGSRRSASGRASGFVRGCM